MLASTLLALAGAALALASPDGASLFLLFLSLGAALTLEGARARAGYGGGGTDIVKDADLKKSEKALKIALKELCYRNLYADVGAFPPLARVGAGDSPLARAQTSSPSSTASRPSLPTVRCLPPIALSALTSPARRGGVHGFPLGRDQARL